MATPDRPRIESLDYLRGLLALSVLVYHYSTWVGLGWVWPLNGLISCLGIYAVSTFYILSGTSLAIVYGRQVVDGAFLREFTIKRLLRITPLFWLASGASLMIPIVKWLARGDASGLPAASRLFWNFSLLFSWLKPEAYIATGAWSIGNELFFYTLFPLFILFWNRSRWLFVGTVGVTLVFPLWAVFHMLDQRASLASQWVLYIQPLNQCFLFAGGDCHRSCPFQDAQDSNYRSLAGQPELNRNFGIGPLRGR